MIYSRAQLDRAAKAARWYRTQGQNPLASCPVLGFPPYQYTLQRDTAQTEQEFLAHRLPCIQIPTGARFGWIVLDLDSPLAISAWEAMSLFRRLPPTWLVPTPSGGLHIYLRVPQGVDSVPSRIVWALESDEVDPRTGRNKLAKHELIEILGDGKLARAVPSFKFRKDGSRGEYRFAPGRSPREIPEPAICPDWVLDLKPVVAPQAPAPALPGPARPRPLVRGHYDFREVLEAIPPDDRVGLAREWGVRFATREPNASGWISCHAVDRDDHRPSAGFSPARGCYAEQGRLWLGLFDLAAYRGAYPTASAACMSLGSIYLCSSSARKETQDVR